MKINITLLIQIINLSITYYLLNRLIFFPIIASLKTKKEVESNFIKSLNKEERSLLEKERELREDLINFQKKVQQKYVILPKKPIEVKFAITYERDEKEVQNLIKEIKELLVEEVPRVR